MDLYEKTRFPEVEAEKSQMDTEKKTRRSSILKPQKPRNPFSTLDFTEPNPDNTLARVARRVSFASSNFVKPFAADPEKNTIWDNTYEEEVNHTDSTKSSCEQTQETKSTDILNLTSIYSDESEEMSFNELSPPQIVYSDEAVTTAKTVNFNKNCVNTIFTNTKDSLISCVKDSNTKTAMKKCSGNKTVDFTLRNDKTIYTENAMEITNSIGVKNELITHSKNDISLITPFNDTMDLTLAKSTIYMQNTMEITTSINKENVNPIINDISLVTPVESKLRSSRLKGNNSVKNIGIQSDKISKENVDVHIKNCSERAQVQSNQEQATMFNHCDMELTRSLSVMDIKENLIDSKFPSYTKRKTINSNRPDGDIKLTCTLPVLLENKRQVDNIENGVTCILDQSEADMECTTTLPFTNVIIPESGQQNKFNSKRKTIHFNESKGNMEFTTTSPVNVIKETCLPNDMKCTAIFPNRGNITENSIYSKQKSIHFNETVGNMDITDISESKNNHLQLKTSHINQPASEMESTICLPIKDININKESNNSDSKRRTIHFDQSECNMEFTSVLPVEEINAYSNVNSHCIPSEDMEFATLLNDNVIKARTTDTPIPKGETINFNQSAASVEFTDTLPIAAIEESKRICGLVSKRKTFYFDQRDGDMEFTTTLPIAEIKENKGKYGSDSKRRTIYFDQIEGDMEFTETLPITDIKENMVKYGLNSKRENICFDQLDNDMEFTAALPIADIKENREKYDLNSKRRTIYFDRLEGNMELTDTLPIADIKENKVKDGLNSKRKTICFDQLEGDMEFTATFSGKENSEISGIKPVQSVHEDMEFRTAFLNKNAVKEKITDPQKAAIHFPQFEDDIEITTTLPSNKDIVYENTDIKQKTINFSQTEADMEFTNFPVKNEIFEEKDYERETIHSNTSKNNIELNLLTKMDSMKNNSELVRTMQFNQVHVEKQYTNKSTTDSFNNHNNNRNISLIDSDNQMEIIVNSEKTVPLPKIEENNAVKEYNDSMSDTSVANKDTSNNKRHSNGENDDDIKKRKIDDINWFEKNSKVPNMLLPVHKNVHDTLECSDESINNKITFFCDKNEKGSEVSNASSIVENKTNAKIDTNQIHSDISKEQKTGKISNSNILYSEPMRIKLRTPIPDFSANLNLQTLDDSVNLKLVPVSTPAASFQMNLTNMSSCTEDTQQLIYATFSKPESLKMLLGKESMPQESTNDILCAKNNITSDNMVKDNENSSHKCDESFKRNEKTFTTNQWNGTQKMSVVENAFLSSNFENNSTEAIRSNHIPEKTDSYDFMEINNENLLSALNNPKTERSCYIEDISLLALAPKDLDDLSLVGNTSNPVNNADLELVSEHKSSEQDQSSNSVSSCSSDYNNYTLRCHSVLANIQKYLISYKTESDQDDSKITLLAKQLKYNSLQIKGLINNFRMPKLHIVNLEEKHKQDMEESSSNVSESTMNAEDDKKAPSMAGLLAPKSLHDRICETAERCKKQWKFVKMEDDHYYFLTLFGTLPFKVHVHPELGMVYTTETYTNLEAAARPVCWYELKLFQQKLKGENLSSVLGAKFDILTLLDYVCMAMEEIVNYHTEYNNLVKKYGTTHHFRMNSDFSVTFEVINLDLIICWKISIKMSLTSSISKDDVTAISKVGEKVREEDIKCIAENTPKGASFLRHFIENVDEYVQRIEKKIKFRRGDKS